MCPGSCIAALHRLQTPTCMCGPEGMHGMQQYTDAATVLCLGVASPISGLISPRVLHEQYCLLELRDIRRLI